MHIAQLLDPFPRREHVEIVEAFLPHMFRSHGEQFLLLRHAPRAQRLQHTPREALLHRLHHFRRIALLRFAHQQMNVVGHHNVSHDDKVVTLADSFEHSKE